MSKEKYVYVDGKKVYVTDEVYYALKKQQNREDYLDKLDRKYLSSNFNDNLSMEMIADTNVDVEKIAYTNMLIEKLRLAMMDLSDEELYIVEKLYFENETLREVAKSIHITHPSLIEKRDKILRKLRKIIGD